MAHRTHLLQTTGRPRCKLKRQTQLGHRNSSLSGNFSINSIRTFNINSSSWRRRQRILGKCFPRSATGGSDWCVTAQSNTTTESESVNHQQDWCGNARSTDKLNGEPVLTGSQVSKEHPFEIKQEDSSSGSDSGVWHLATSPPVCRILVSCSGQPDLGTVVS